MKIIKAISLGLLLSTGLAFQSAQSMTLTKEMQKRAQFGVVTGLAAGALYSLYHDKNLPEGAVNSIGTGLGATLIATFWPELNPSAKLFSFMLGSLFALRNYTNNLPWYSLSLSESIFTGSATAIFALQHYYNTNYPQNSHK